MPTGILTLIGFAATPTEAYDAGPITVTDLPIVVLLALGVIAAVTTARDRGRLRPVLALSVLVTILVWQKFETQLKQQARETQGTHEKDAGSGSIAVAAFALGVSNMRRRKARMLDYLDRAGRQGDAEVFIQRAQAFDQGIYGDDPVAAYANYFAYIHSAAASNKKRILAALLAAYASELTPEQRARAEAAALRWLSPCCGGAGERP